MMADREGRLEDRPLRIKAQAFPYRDGLDVGPALAWLHQHAFIKRYSVGGTAYIQVLKFGQHQSPHVKEASSTIPAPDSPGASTSPVPEIPAPAALTPSSLTPDSGLLTPDSSSLRSLAVRRAPKRARSRTVPADFEVTEGMRTWATEACPNVDIDAETALFRDHEFKDPHGDWPAAWRKWMRRSPEFKRNGTAKPKYTPSLTTEELEAREAARGRG